MWNMRKRHFSHSWQNSRSEDGGQGRAYLRAASAVGAKRRAFTATAAEATRASARRDARFRLDPLLSTRSRRSNRRFLPQQPPTACFAINNPILNRFPPSNFQQLRSNPRGVTCPYPADAVGSAFFGHVQEELLNEKMPLMEL